MARVLHIHFGKEGGAERFFVSLATALSKAGVEQSFVIRPGRSWDGAIAPLGPVRRSNFSRFTVARPLVRRHIRHVLEHWKPDAVMTWMPRAAEALPDGGTAMRLCRLGDYPANLKHFGPCDVLVGNTPGIAQCCDALGWEKGLATISNFPRPVAPMPVPRSRHDTPEGVPLIVTAGRFVPRKNMAVAVRAAARVPGAWLWLIGDGKERRELERLAADLGIADRTRFIGWVEEPVHHLAAGDVFLLPSRHEPLGNVLLEAWAAGIPSVSSRCEGPSWFMRDGIDGLMAPIDDIGATAAALQRMLSDRVFAASCVAAAHDRIAELFSPEAVVRQYLDVFAMTRAQARGLGRA